MTGVLWRLVSRREGRQHVAAAIIDGNDEPMQLQAFRYDERTICRLVPRDGFPVEFFLSDLKGAIAVVEADLEADHS